MRWEVANIIETRFNLGEIRITVNARKNVNLEDMFTALAKHEAGDWGKVSKWQRNFNENAFQRRLPIRSIHRDRNNRLIVITTGMLHLETLIMDEIN